MIDPDFTSDVFYVACNSYPLQVDPAIESVDAEGSNGEDLLGRGVFDTTFEGKLLPSFNGLRVSIDVLDNVGLLVSKRILRLKVVPGGVGPHIQFATDLVNILQRAVDDSKVYIILVLASEFVPQRHKILVSGQPLHFKSNKPRLVVIHSGSAIVDVHDILAELFIAPSRWLPMLVARR